MPDKNSKTGLHKEPAVLHYMIKKIPEGWIYTSLLENGEIKSEFVPYEDDSEELDRPYTSI